MESAFNRSAALVLLIVFAPLMLVVAWLILRRDGRPVFYADHRVGRDGTLFECLKFRTMVRDADRLLERVLAEDPAARAEWERHQKLRNDPRVTPVGRFLRCTSLDELPQLFNVVRGQMNLVGPRPMLASQLRLYGPVKFHYLSVRPGMTGLWQVSGRHNVPFSERVRLDREYVEGRTFWLDCWILLRTVRVVLRQEGA